MQGTFNWTYDDGESEKTFELTYDFTPGEREVRWGDNAHPGWPAEVDIYGAACVEIDGKPVPKQHEQRTYWGKWFLNLLDNDKDLKQRI